jgi:hypothetical protein
MDVRFNGVTAQCLVDSGCDRRIIPRRMVSRARLFPTDVEVTAANGADLNVLGLMRLRFMVQDMPMYADLIVSDSIDEFMIGIDFLSRVKAVWDFSKGILLINGVSVPLKQRPSRANVRRVFVREEVIASPMTQVNVPVRLSFTNLHAPRCDWVTEPREVQPGLLAARTLLPESDEWAAVQCVNTGKTPKRIRIGIVLGEAQPGMVMDEYSLTRVDGPLDVATEVKTVHACSAGVDSPSSPINDAYSHLEPIISTLPEELTHEQKQGVRRVQTRAERRREIDGTPKVTVGDSPSPSADSRYPSGTAAESGNRELRHTELVSKMAPNAIEAGVSNWSSEYLAEEQQ